MLFVWTMNAFKSYRPGTVAVAANSLAEARSIAKANAKRFIIENYHYGWFDEDDEPVLDDWGREEFDTKFAEFLIDIEKDPVITDHVMIMGGD